MAANGRILLSPLLAATFTLAGCAKNGDTPQGGVQGVSRSEAASLNADRAGAELPPEGQLTAETHFAAGQFMESQGVTDKAIEQYTAALKLDPRHRQSLYRLGMLYVKAGAFPEAIDIWQAYVRATGENPAAYSNLGLCYEAAGRAGDAEVAYQAGLRKNDRNAPCCVNYGLLLARLGRGDEALAQLRKALPEAQAHYNLGSIYEQTGRTAAAREEYQKAIAADPSLAGPRERLDAIK